MANDSTIEQAAAAQSPVAPIPTPPTVPTPVPGVHYLTDISDKLSALGTRVLPAIKLAGAAYSILNPLSTTKIAQTVKSQVENKVVDTLTDANKFADTVQGIAQTGELETEPAETVAKDAAKTVAGKFDKVGGIERRGPTTFGRGGGSFGTTVDRTFETLRAQGLAEAPQGGHAGGGVASEEELARSGRFVKVSRSGQLTDQGKTPDFNLRNGEVGYQVKPDGTYEVKDGQESPAHKIAIDKYAKEVFPQLKPVDLSPVYGNTGKLIRGPEKSSQQKMVENAGLVYKGELMKGSGVHMFEHPNHPGKTAALDTADMTPAAVTEKMNSKLKDFGVKRATKK